MLYKEIVPKTKTQFHDYNQFYKRTSHQKYLRSLPQSAHDVTYYYYEGFFSDKSAYHAAFSKEDYILVLQNRVESYNTEYTQADYTYDGQHTLYLDIEEMQKKNIDYLDKIMEDDKNNYYFLVYNLYEGQEVYFYEGVLCNDETCEVIEFACRICN